VSEERRQADTRRIILLLPSHPLSDSEAFATPLPFCYALSLSAAADTLHDAIIC